MLQRRIPVFISVYTVEICGKPVGRFGKRIEILPVAAGQIMLKKALGTVEFRAGFIGKLFEKADFFQLIFNKNKFFPGGKFPVEENSHRSLYQQNAYNKSVLNHFSQSGAHHLLAKVLICFHGVL